MGLIYEDMKVFAKKIGMTQVYDERGFHTAVTILQLKQCVVLGGRSMNKDGYLGRIVGEIADGFVAKKSVAGQFKNFPGVKRVKEEKISSEDQIEIGKKINSDDFVIGDKLIVYGVSKGKGFAGTVKRHSFNTGPKTHGSNNYRQPGSIGPTYPQRTILGRRMAGHMGADNIKLKQIKVIRIEKEINRIWVKGSVPGANKSEVILEK